MLGWHVATATFLFRWIFGDPKVDMRFLVVGAVAPDVVDMAIVTATGGETAELWAHSLLAPTVVAVVAIVATRRGRRRRAWMAMVVAWLLHLLVDGMWVHEAVFLWPVFGWELPIGGETFWAGAWQRAMSDPWRWILEAVGVAYLVWLWQAAGLSDRPARARLAATGRID